MKSLHLNIVSFTVPFPANYGGVIDVYHKLAALHAIGIRIHLHCFRYDREKAPELENLCESVHYYPRKTGISEQFSLRPFIVKGRRSDELLRRLLSNDYPVLFEGMHSCYYLPHPLLKGRMLIYRESNIEHHYYYHLFKAEKRIIPKLFFLFESLRLYAFQGSLKHASCMLAVSEEDTRYLKNKFPRHQVVYLPSFHGNNRISSMTGMGKYAFYHGNLSVAENVQAAEFLIREVFPGLNIPLVIAGLNPPENLKNLARENGVEIHENVTADMMDELLRNAHVNILVTFQSTGLKLKLLNTLFKGRFVLVNSKMLSGTGLDDYCLIAADAQGFKSELQRLFSLPFDQACLQQRNNLISGIYSDSLNARVLADILSPFIHADNHP